jgi:hypothetical protein
VALCDRWGIRLDAEEAGEGGKKYKQSNFFSPESTLDE